jgi:hypothetical protein
VITLGSWFFPDASNTPYIAMAFAEVAGFSKFGSYTGSGSADGPFVYCGFKPRWIMVKPAVSSPNGGGGWLIYDSARDSGNVLSSLLIASNSNAESVGSTNQVDFLSNGFKLRSTGGGWNDGGTLIFAAFAEAPFKYATAR